MEDSGGEYVNGGQKVCAPFIGVFVGVSQGGCVCGVCAAVRGAGVMKWSECNKRYLYPVRCDRLCG